jgi:flagellar biosynthetic protein FliQ
MDDASVIHIVAMALIVVAKVSAPILVTSLVVGLGISMFQSVTQIQEVTLSFVPKLVAVAAVLVLMGSWMLGQLVGFTRELYEMVPRLVGAA